MTKLEIINVSYDDTLALMSKGHHAPAEFLAACETAMGSALPVSSNGPMHKWVRCVPARPGSDCMGYYYHTATPGARGAFPCTVAEWD